MADRTAIHYELARALISFEAGDVTNALRIVRDATRLVAGDHRLAWRVGVLEHALGQAVAGADAGQSVARAYQDVVDELRRSE
jgi:hypothetical protein